VYLIEYNSLLNGKNNNICW